MVKMRYGLPPSKPEEVTMRVRMVKTTRAIPHPGSPEVDYLAGHDYDLPEWLAEAFFRGGEGDPAEAHEQQPVAARKFDPTAVSEGGGGQTSPDAATARPRPNSARRKAKK
jgi:hypothetical protein